ncbi:LysR substrate-binding domain-containing protein [Lacticaseibacillus pabuli]|uniref:LysR substrate-binding domain-containing protein n=1 Tax=Lacticaseibacillus pabuli TaxID=3025672 RepID=A0ABY7WS03_9LACO|nr:LysR substrate-binding domain-containing protein [Lacticaseibacillus sp. KACC 23028]WDF82511.1 LysR substrate-binding domain-containing protein [Lacticaseibacillus sp. KACC 23028]
MNTRDLDYFAKLVEIKNFSAVADYFHVTQPTVSLAVKRLETNYGIQLVVRDQSHNTLTVTPAGEQLAIHARVILSELQQASQELSAMQAPTITLGLPPMIGNYYFPQLIPRLMTENIMQHLATVEAGSSALLDRLRNGELDMALLGSAGRLNEPDLESDEIGSTPFCLIASKQRHLSSTGEVSFADLASVPFVTLTEGYVHDQVFNKVSAAAGFHPQIAFRTGDVSLLKKMVRQNVGVAMLAELAVQPDDDFQVFHLTDVDLPRFSIAVAYRKQQLLSPMMQQLKAELMKGK